jgi:hypothetical protein
MPLSKEQRRVLVEALWSADFTDGMGFDDEAAAELAEARDAIRGVAPPMDPDEEFDLHGDGRTFTIRYLDEDLGDELAEDLADHTRMLDVIHRVENCYRSQTDLLRNESEDREELALMEIAVAEAVAGGYLERLDGDHLRFVCYPDEHSAD